MQRASALSAGPDCLRLSSQTGSSDSGTGAALSEDGPSIAAELHPIITLQPEGFVIALIDAAHPQYSLSKHAMEQAANVIGLELVKKQAVKERSRRYKNEFFSDFVDGLIASEQELTHRIKYYRLSNHPYYICAVIKKDASSDTVRDSAAAEPDGSVISERDRHYYALKSEFSRLEQHFVLFTKNDFFCAIIALQRTQDAKEGKDSRFLEQMRQIVEGLYQAHGIPVSIGIGNAAPSLADVPLSYKEAAGALQIGYDARKRRFVQTYRAKNLNNLLRMIPKEELKEYYEDTFKELLHIEGKERSDLLKTLSIFYETHCQLAETAKQLFVHRNTVTYRLEKCERLTGRDLRDPVESLRFRTAFQMEAIVHSD